jgi:RNA polymerase sigma-70 factor (ECF subfamily)
MSRESVSLLKAAQEGDVNAFAELFETLRPMVHAVAYRLVGPTDADDVVMNTYLKAWQSLPRFRRQSTMKTWLFRIAHNCGLDLIRSRTRHESHLVHEDGGEDALVRDPSDPTQTTPDEQAHRSEAAARVRAALDEIPEEHRLVLLLRFADGLSYAEIAAAAGLSIGTVMSRIFYGKRKLRKVLEERNDVL